MNVPRLPSVPAVVPAALLLAVTHVLGCAQASALPVPGESADAAIAVDAASPGLDGSLTDARSPLDASGDSGGIGDAAVDARDSGSPPVEAGTPEASAPEAGDPAADCLLAGSPPDGGDPATNAYMQSCGGDPAAVTTAQNGSPCTIGVEGQHCFLQCAFCKSAGGTPPATLVLPCTLPINNCCGVLTCGGCPTCS
jgi:hypothetical protein